MNRQAKKQYINISDLSNSPSMQSTASKERTLTRKSNNRMAARRRGTLIRRTTIRKITIGRVSTGNII
jgi:hypothetical protein